MYVTLLLDVEDVVTPAADDYTREVALALTAEGVSATFCIAGMRAEQWRERGRTDVVDALAPHDVGYHSYGHSLHPTVAEYLAPLGWEDGVEAAMRVEGPGVRAVEEICGRTPSCYGGPGNTWGPQVNAAMRALGVPAQVYAHTRAPGNDVHLLDGSICYPTGRYLGDSLYHDLVASRAAVSEAISGLRGDAAVGGQWREAFAGHPSRIFSEEFWDGPNFLRGAMPPREEWRPPRPKGADGAGAAIRGLREAVRRVRAAEGLELRTIREMNELYATADALSLSGDEMSAARRVAEANLRAMCGWVVLPEGFDGGNIPALTLERLPTLRRLRLRG